ncbi:MAG: sugar ABC transporter permease [Candidatus Marinimicrobia bacterium]|nr:sugar ABC transporter permease [Candidatus Neomarinimicrobiota bacterium]
MTPGNFNHHGVWAVYKFEMGRFKRTAWQSVVAPVLTTTLYFVVFGAAIGSRIQEMDGINYGAFIVPGLIMMTLLIQSIFNGSFGIYFPKFNGTVYELLSAPISYAEAVLAYVGAAATKSVILGLIMLATASFFVELKIQHPIWMMIFMILIATTFCLFGFILGIWASNFEQLSMVPTLIITPLTFLGGAFYSIDLLPGIWRTISLFNPVVYLVNGFRWSFYDSADISVWVSLFVTLAFLALCMAIIAFIFKTGYKLKP